MINDKKIFKDLKLFNESLKLLDTGTEFTIHNNPSSSK